MSKDKDIREKILENGKLINDIVDYLIYVRELNLTPEGILEYKSVIMQILDEFVDRRLAAVFGRDIDGIGDVLSNDQNIDIGTNFGRQFCIEKIIELNYLKTRISSEEYKELLDRFLINLK